ncbi:unnamed protein product [Phytophthora fragariaefolia]|uniref:Unnamed protein product n=1 Tax=Phytophthora fragariaefolia TaxID=1490495 RepID=A0A9W6Y9J4_9STRA|nr:unnamed protein product [Phytophthora fragariaefolia]
MNTVRQFHQRTSDKRFVANIRLVRPSQEDSNRDLRPSNQAREEEEEALDADPVDKRLAAVPEALRVYSNLIFLIGERPARSLADPGTYVKETRLVRFINEVYDARYEDLSASCMNSCGSVRAYVLAAVVHALITLSRLTVCQIHSALPHESLRSQAFGGSAGVGSDRRTQCSPTRKIGCSVKSSPHNFANLHCHCSGSTAGSREYAVGELPFASPKKQRATSSVLDQFNAPLLRPAALSDPTSSPQDSCYRPPDTPSSTGAAIHDGNSDCDDEAQLQSRLGSLLERMKKRQQASGS